jgi:hypothetical protein
MRCPNFTRLLEMCRAINCRIAGSNQHGASEFNPESKHDLYAGKHRLEIRALSPLRDPYRYWMPPRRALDKPVCQISFDSEP